MSDPTRATDAEIMNEVTEITRRLAEPVDMPWWLSPVVFGGGVFVGIGGIGGVLYICHLLTGLPP